MAVACAEFLLRPLRLAIFSIMFVDRESFLDERIECMRAHGAAKRVSYSQLIRVEMDASILSIGGNCP